MAAATATDRQGGLTVAVGAARTEGRWLPLLLVGLAFLVRLVRLGDANVWWDEALAVWAVRKPWSEMTAWTASDVHPPLFFWALWPWQRLVGETEFALRYLSVIAGVLSAVMAWALARRLGGRLAGGFALALVATSRFAVWWSMELRMYMLAALAIAWATYGAICWLSAAQRRAGRPWNGGWLAAVAGSLAALYSVYLAALMVTWLAAATWLVLLRRRTSRQWFVAWLTGLAGLALAFAPWLAYAVPRMASWRLPEPAPRLGFVAQLWLTLLATGRSTELNDCRAATAVFWLGGSAAIAALAYPLLRRSAPMGKVGPATAAPAGPPGAFLLAGGLLVLAPLVIWGVAQPRSVFYTPRVEARYFVPFLVPVYALLAWGLARLVRAHRPVGLAAALCLFGPGLVSLPSHYTARRLQADPYAMVLAIWSQARPDDVVLLVSGNRYPLFRYYYDRAWVQPWNRPSFELPAESPPAWADRPMVVEFPSRGSDMLGETAWQNELARLAREHRRVWLVEWGRELQDPGREVEAWLTRRLPRVLSEGYGADALHLYASDGLRPLTTGLSSRFPGTMIASTAHAETERSRLQEAAPRTRSGPRMAPLVGFASRAARPGDTLYVSVFASGLRKGDVARLELFASPAAMTVPVGQSVLAVSEVMAGDAANGPLPSAPAWLRLPLQLSVDDRLPGGRLHWRATVEALTARGQPECAASGEVAVRENPALSGPPCSGARAGEAVHVGPMVLHSGRIVPHRVRAGGAVVVDLCWTLPGRAMSPAGSPLVFAHLLGPPHGPEGSLLWAGQDGPPSGGRWPWQEGGRPAGAVVFDRHLLRVPDSAPPGAYTVEIGVYEAQTGERWPVRGPGAKPATRAVILGEVAVW